MTAKRARSQRNRPVTRFAKLPKALMDGKVRCPACSKVLTPTEHGGIRAHRDPSGDPCAYRYSGHRDIELTEAPPVVMPGRGRPRKPGAATRVARDPSEPSRLDAGSNCRECGKWLPGERQLCGACFVAGGAR